MRQNTFIPVCFEKQGRSEIEGRLSFVWEKRCQRFSFKDGGFNVFSPKLLKISSKQAFSGLRACKCYQTSMREIKVLNANENSL